MGKRKSDVSVWMSKDERLARTRISTVLQPIYQRVENAKANRGEAADAVRRAHHQVRAQPGPEQRKLLRAREAVLLGLENEMAAALAQMEAKEQEFLADPDYAHVAEYVISENRKRVLYKSSQGSYNHPGGCTHYIEYRLKESVLVDAGAGNPVYYPEVVPMGHVSAERIVREVAEGLRVNEGTVQLVMGQLAETILSNLRENRTVSLGDMFVLGASLKGTCVGEETRAAFRRSFEPSIKVRTMPRFQRKFRDGLGARLTQASQKHAEIVSIRAVMNPSPDGVLAPGTLVNIDGVRFKYDPAAEDEGVFLYAAGLGEHRLEPVSLAKKNTPDLFLAVLPKDIPEGTYKPEIRLRGRNSRKIRSYSVPLEITVRT